MDNQAAIATAVVQMKDAIERWYTEHPERRTEAQEWYKEVKEREVQKWD